MSLHSRVFGAIVAVACVCAGGGSAWEQDRLDGIGSREEIVGTWDVVNRRPVFSRLSTMVFAVDDGRLTASDSLAGQGRDVSVADGMVRFVLDTEGGPQRVEVEVEGDTIAGTVVASGASPDGADEIYELTGTRRAPVEGDRAAIVDVIERWAETSAAKDLDAMMALFSADYRDDILDGKKKLREYWKLAMENGMTDGMRVGFNSGQITINGDTARTGRVYFQAKSGGFFYVFELEKEPDGVWRITSSSY
jgi:ketosteroid isomerase-like protein